MRIFEKVNVIVKLCLIAVLLNLRLVWEALTSTIYGVVFRTPIPVALGGAAVLSFVFAFAAMPTGCATLSKPCAEALTYIATTNAILGEAGTAVDQAYAFISQAPDLPEGERKKALNAVYVAKSAIQSAQHALAGAKNACEKPDVTASLKEFSEAWVILKGILALVVGGTSGPPQVADPIAFDPSLVQ
jgi:hypothetical protein